MLLVIIFNLIGQFKPHMTLSVYKNVMKIIIFKIIFETRKCLRFDC